MPRKSRFSVLGSIKSHLVYEATGASRRILPRPFNRARIPSRRGSLSAVFVIYACIFASRAQAQREYNFNGCTAATCNAGSREAFKGEATTEPPAANNFPATEFTDANYTAVGASDDSRQIQAASAVGQNALVRFVFILTEPEASVLDLTVDWEGQAQNISGTTGTIKLYLWNATAGSYTDTGQSTSSTTDVTLTFTTSSPAQFIDELDGNRVTVLLTNTDDNRNIRTDFVRLLISQCTPGDLSRCADGNACTTEACSSGLCTHAPIVACTNWDGCCPAGCNNTNDVDCVCGSSQVDCCVAHVNAGCQDTACCHTVCAVDPYCCETEWDQICVDEAILICEASGCNPRVCGDGIIEVGEECDFRGVTADCCNSECLFESNATVCRPAVGICDVAETCTGNSAICPEDAKSTGVCRPAAGICDLADFCDGVNNDCPADVKSRAVCRPSTGPCDVPESCNGVSNTCPADFVIARCTNSDGCCPPTCNSANDNDCLVTTVLKWESVLTHGTVGPVALEIPDTGLFSEPRSGIKKIVVTFDGPLDPATAIPANITVCGNDVNNSPMDLSGIFITTATSAGDTKLEINFAPITIPELGLPNFARYRIALSTNIHDAGGAPIQGGTGGLSRILTALQGDASGDVRVNATDLALCRSLVGINPINPAIQNQVRCDVSNDGRINATDLGLVRGRVGQDARFIPDPVCP